MQGADQPQNDSEATTRAERNPFAQRSGPMAVPFLPRRGYVDGPFGQLHYRDIGSGTPLNCAIRRRRHPSNSHRFLNHFTAVASAP